MVIALTGNNSYALRQRLSELVNKFVADHGEIAVERIDAEEAEVRVVSEALLSSGFFSSNKLLVLRGLSKNKAAAEQVEQNISSIPPSTDVIIYEPITDKRTSFYKFLKSQTQLEEHNQLDEAGLARWLSEQAKAQGVSLTFGDAKYLVDRAGTNQMALANELDKLLLCDKSISRQTIDSLVEPTPQSKIFDLLDAAFGSDKKKALQLYADQRAQKIEPQAIMAMLAWQLQILALVKFAGRRNANEIAQDSGISPYPIRKAQVMAVRISAERLKALVSEALEIDYKSKTSRIDLDETLKTYIISI